MTVEPANLPPIVNADVATSSGGAGDRGHPGQRQRPGRRSAAAERDHPAAGWGAGRRARRAPGHLHAGHRLFRRRQLHLPSQRRHDDRARRGLRHRDRSGAPDLRQRLSLSAAHRHPAPDGHRRDGYRLRALGPRVRGLAQGRRARRPRRERPRLRSAFRARGRHQAGSRGRALRRRRRQPRLMGANPEPRPEPAAASLPLLRQARPHGQRGQPGRRVAWLSGRYRRTHGCGSHQRQPLADPDRGSAAAS